MAVIALHKSNKPLLYDCVLRGQEFIEEIKDREEGTGMVIWEDYKTI